MTLSPTDFPCPVAPATKTWGIFVKSARNTSLDIVLPKIRGNSKSFLMNFSVLITDLRLTISRFLLGTSIPIVPFPGIGAIILIPRAERLNAISSSRFLIFEIFIPASGTIS